MTGKCTPFLLLHGFGQSAASWAEVEALLVERLGDCAVYALDFPGHGEGAGTADLGPAAFEMSAVCESVRKFAQAILEKHGVAPVIVGYSMGGRIALECLVRFGAELPASALVLESAGLGPHDDAARAAFKRRNLAWAQQVRDQGVSAFMEYWASLSLFASQAQLSDEKRVALHAGRVANNAEALALTFEGTGQHKQALENETLSALATAVDRGLPIAYFAGELDEKYVAVAGKINAYFVHGGANLPKCMELPKGRPGVSARVIPNAGHNVHLEAPEAFVTNILCFLEEKAQ